MSQVVGYAPGIFDLFHIGHLNLLLAARERCDVLVAGVLTDEMCLHSKGWRPVIPFNERCEIVRHIAAVDRVHAEAVPGKIAAWEAVRFHRIVKGDDWRGTAKGEQLERDMARVGAEVVYVPYTASTSSTKLRAAIAGLTGGHADVVAS